MRTHPSAVTLSSVLVLALVGCLPSEPRGSLTPVSGSGAPDHTSSVGSTTLPIVIDHNSVALFEQIPERYVTAARNTRLLFSDRSVGQNINEALDCLTATAWYYAPASCRRDYYAIDGSTWLWKTYSRTEYENGLVPARIRFTPDPVKYSRANWTFEFRSGDWQPLVQNFVQELVPTYVGSKDVLSFQFSYLNILNGSTIDDTGEGYFTDQPHHGYYPNGVERWDISDVEAVEAAHPNKVFIAWTTSLARSIGTLDGTRFNTQMREYAAARGRVLFDVADILSHTDQGVPCYDNRDGVEYCGSNGCENHPDDGVAHPAICQDYTTELDGGHLGSVSAGKVRIAKAFWVLMARVAGWDGVSP